MGPSARPQRAHGSDALWTAARQRRSDLWSVPYRGLDGRGPQFDEDGLHAGEQ